jgi:hypothetical protein
MPELTAARPMHSSTGMLRQQKEALRVKLVVAKFVGAQLMTDMPRNATN